MTRLPDFVVIGAMKCATSTLANQLSRQRGVFVTRPKEPCYFSDDEVYERGLEPYAALYDAAEPGDLVGEASTHYTKLPTYPDTIARMQEHGLDSKFIYVMRHPVDRLVSHYIHAWTDNELKSSVSESVDSHTVLVEYGCYARQIQPFLDAFGPERVLPVFYDRLTSKPDAELQRVCDFIGLGHAAHWDHSQARRNVSAERMRTSPLRDALVHAPLVRSLRRLLPVSMRSKVKRLWQLRDRPELNTAAMQQVVAVFDKDLAKLGALLGVELNCANFKAVTSERPLDWKE